MLGTVLGPQDPKGAVMIESVLSEDSGGHALLMANAFLVPCCVYVLLLVYPRGGPVDYGACTGFAKQPYEPTTW